MKVTIEKPEIITLLFKQEKDDKDYGSCLWAWFYIDTKNYTLSIESDCGNYVYGWVPTPNSESFLHLLARLNEDYLLSKISDPTVIDRKATAAEILEMVKEIADAKCIELDEWEQEQISDACYRQNNERDLVDAVLDAVISTEVRKALELDIYNLYASVTKTYPANAKRISKIFHKHIRPVIRSMEIRE